MPVADANLIVYLRTPATLGNVEVVAVEVPGQGVIDAPTSNLRTAPEEISYAGSFHVIKMAHGWCIHIPFICDVWCVDESVLQQPATKRRTRLSKPTVRTPSHRKRPKR